jgi:formate/nitrite transporter FocA (FNT family)
MRQFHAVKQFSNNKLLFVISGFRHEVAENCVLLGYDVASGRNFLLAFRDNLSFPASRVNP